MSDKPEKPSGDAPASPDPSSEVSALPEPVTPTYRPVHKAHDFGEGDRSYGSPTGSPPPGKEGDKQ